MAGRVTKGDLLRQRIVEASLKLFADQGFRATTVQQIADEVGISKQRLLYHFSSKEELHRAVLETVADQWKELLPVLLGAAVRGGEMASRLAPLLDFLRNQPHAARYVMRDIISPEREAVNTMGQLVWPWVEQLAEENRLAHVRFQEICSVSPGLAPAWGTEGVVLLNPNPIHVAATFHTRELLDEEDDVPASVMFFPVGNEVRTAVLEEEGRRIAAALKNAGPLRFDDLAAVEPSLDRETLVEVSRDLAEVGLAAFA